MKLNRSLQLLVLAVCASGIPALADDKKSSSPDEKKMMEKMMQAGTPGAAHRKLDPLVGKFSVKSKMWMDPSKPPHESSGTAERAWIMGNRYLEERFQGEHEGQPFTGVGTFGYDNVTKKYFGTWLDSMSTGMATMKGTLSGDTLKYTGMMSDPMAGKEVPYTMNFKIVNNDTQTMEMWCAGPDGKQMKSMEMTYTRIK
ncbi:DUF1579 domain-containing protein [Massilia endophytica]|uniref:DUF1579 domain-containing protein n=1 Tax=Massilia endophytica TaxID=2899220 RepID=UPI001E3038E3|nr:DUF1579 domain-containing protein [Massilia endophytica]UGQ46920.1 DUF1579 domain-containing protein [Massilia endophytica]